MSWFFEPYVGPYGIYYKEVYNKNSINLIYPNFRVYKKMQYRKSQKNLQGSNVIYIFAIQTKGK